MCVRAGNFSQRPGGFVNLNVIEDIERPVNTTTPGCKVLKKLALACLMAGIACFAQAQTYKVGSPSSSNHQPGKPSNETPANPIGWGSNIQNARLAGAAQEALRAGKYSEAADYAQRAVQAAPNDAQLWFLLGYAARLAGQSQRSVNAYNQGLHLAPSSVEGLSGLAQTYSRMGRRDEAQRLLTQILESNPRRANDAELLGEIYIQQGQYDQAITVLRRSDQIQPSARAELLMALSYQHLKQFDQANRCLQLAKSKAPNDPEVQRSIAGFYRETGNYPAAIAALKALPHKSPDEIAELAYTYQLSGKKDESARLYGEAANAVPQNLGLQLSAAQAEVAANAIEAAEKFLKRAAGIDSENYRLHAIRAEMARLRDDDPEALREFNLALQHLPEAPPEGPLYGVQLHMDLMELNKNLQDDAAAQRELQAAQSEIGKLDIQGPGRSEFLRLRALIKLNSGDLEGAGSDLKEALQINGTDPNALQLDGDLLVKLGQPQEAIAVYHKVLAADPDNRAALISLGYTYRSVGQDHEAEQCFERLKAADPRSFVPYLAFGDIYTSRREFEKAEIAYRKAHELAPANTLTIARAMNAAIEAHHFPVAAEWLARASAQAQQDPAVMREKERYLRWIGDYKDSEEVGREAIKKLPHDRDVVVYLGYDFLALGQYDELSELASHYDSLMPKEPDIPLFEGYIHKHAGQDEEAEKDFTRVVERDPAVTTAYVNRGYVRNDLHRPAEAASDFEAALRLEPKNGEAHLGLASSSLALRRPKVALRQAQLAEAELGDSLLLHLIRATAYGDLGMTARAAAEYQIAVKESPKDPTLRMALADTFYGLHRYSEAINELQTAAKLSPNDPVVDARMARTYAQLKDRDQALHYVQLAGQHANTQEQQNAILVSVGEALSLLGDEKAALQYFEKALMTPESDRVGVRLAVAKLEIGEGQVDGARRQIALAFMESRTGDAPPPTPNQYLQAADIFLAAHDFQLAAKYFQSALAAGAPETAVRVGLANTYLAEGDTARAEGQISLVSNFADGDPNYQYLLAKANVYRQQHQSARALTAFAQAAGAAGEDETAAHELLQTAGDEGLRLNRRVSFLADFSVEPIFEDTTVYPLDAKLDVTKPIPGQENLLPLPRSSLETQWTGAYHLHFNGLPDASGFFQMRNARGQISLPSADTIIDRDTTDYSFNFALNPTVHVGANVFTFSTGIQETVRRDSQDPIDMDQNLFRQFVYMSTSSFGNMVSLSGYAIHESGPFINLAGMHSSDRAASLEFRVGRPWGKTALVTGWGARDDQFSPVDREFYYTSSYIGVEQKVSERLRVRAVAEDLRSWRVELNDYAIAQALRPAGSVEYSPTRNWTVQASVAYSRNMGFHAYDAVQSGFSLSYAKPIGRMFKDETGGEVNVRYPIRFAVGVQQEDFFEFPGAQSQQFRPFVSINLF
jgi:tetratricopeptide (TPR) repeat protein